MVFEVDFFDSLEFCQPQLKLLLTYFTLYNYIL